VSTLDANSGNPVGRAVRRGGRGLLVVIVAVGATTVVGLLVASLALPNLFGTSTHEQPNAVVLAQLDDLSQYQAATGRFQTIVDVDEDANYLPDWVKGERKVLAAEGDVAAAVDFGSLDDSALDVSADGKSVTVHLPPPALQPADLDRANTRVIARERGILDRVDDALTNGNPSADDELYARAESKLTEAAGQSDLQARAEDNTRQLLTGLLQDAGYRDVTVVFDAPSADPATDA
jgi:hypothetical protein